MSTPAPSPRPVRVLLAYSWGHQWTRPGTSNDAIAREVAAQREEFEFLLVQVEIAIALREMGIEPDCVVGTLNAYINTYDVAAGMVRWLSKRGISPANCEISIACHATHWSGCQLVLRRFGIVRSERVPMHVPYDPNSAHWYTRSAWQAFMGKVLRGVGYIVRGEVSLISKPA